MYNLAIISLRLFISLSVMLTKLQGINLYSTDHAQSLRILIDNMMLYLNKISHDGLHIFKKL